MLPIHAILPRLLHVLEASSTAVLQAPPGAGKTTVVPLALLDAPWCAGQRILMLEPRRIAARAAARHMAAQLDEDTGRTVGYRTRFDTRVSERTRIEVVTEGVLTRMLQHDPEFNGYAAILFDEFHERTLQADLGLALALESQQVLRPDLRLLIMSATINAERLAPLLGDPPVVVCEGRAYPVAERYLPIGNRPLVDATVRAIHQALAEESGSILVFLPGTGEIRRVMGALQGSLPPEVRLTPLHGQLDPHSQDQAIAAPPAGVRKVVLATDIAETSLTIDGIRVVVDAGLQRRPRFDANSGMSRLVTTSVSRASADQRKGRAGRQEPGTVYRLWDQSSHQRLPPDSAPEIQNADLAALVLELAKWGVRSRDGLRWLDAPPAAHWQQAQDLLRLLGAVEDDGSITRHGEAMHELPLHPRLAHLLLHGRSLGAPRLTAELAAVLSERDMLGRGAGADLEHRVRALREAITKGKSHEPRFQQVLRVYRDLAGAGHKNRDTTPVGLGRLLALAYPDRIARRRPGGQARYQLSNGRGAVLADGDPLGRQEWLVAADLDGSATEARIYLAAVLDGTDLADVLADGTRTSSVVDWDESRGMVVCRNQQHLGKLLVDETVEAAADPEALRSGLLARIRQQGLEALPWTPHAQQVRARLALMHRLWPEQWPSVADAGLLQGLEEWLGPYLISATRWADLRSIDLEQALYSRLPHGLQGQLARLAPERLGVPAGNKVTLDYTQGDAPVMAVKLQALFGMTETPRIADGRVAVVCHLLSPAGRPLAVTADLASFWRQAYPEVRKDMRGRYPKHPWPEDPLTAAATLSTKRRQGNQDD